jgi:hypothetical protein
VQNTEDFPNFLMFKVVPDVFLIPAFKGTHARDFMVRFSQFFGIIQ